MTPQTPKRTNATAPSRPVAADRLTCMVSPLRIAENCRVSSLERAGESV
jgi:hypothetical protein